VRYVFMEEQFEGDRGSACVWLDVFSIQ